MAYVLKIKYENNLRRLILQKNEIESESFTFAHLEGRIRELFQLPAVTTLAVTYTDEENDVVTMGNDQDLRDALVEQALNPLRIHVTLLKTRSGDTGKAVELDNADVVLRRLLRTLSSAPETVGENLKHAFQPYEPLFEGVKSPAQIPCLVESVLQKIAEQVTSAVKNGAAAASAAAAAAAPGSSAVGAGAVPAEPKTCQGQKFEEPKFCSFAGPSVFDSAEPEHDVPGTVHLGVTCDVCGVSPIVGDRWKSKEKYDYDLCHDCYEKHGSEKEYMKINEPKFRPRRMHGPLRMGHPLHPMGPPFAPPFVPPITPPFAPLGPHGPFYGGRPCHMRGHFGTSGREPWGRMMGPCSAGDKLYARFVCDVTVFDGTEVAPGTQFVKIWRLRNSGTAPWPVNTSLVFVGGDELGRVSSVPLEILEQGVAPEEEMEASVDMVAPEKPGRYVSHWRLASPAGPKFGQRLSVIIQVVPKTILDGVAAELVTVGDDATVQESESVAGSSSQTQVEESANLEKVLDDSSDIGSLRIAEENSSSQDVSDADLSRLLGVDLSKIFSGKNEELLPLPSVIESGREELFFLGSTSASSAETSLPAVVTEAVNKTVEGVSPPAAEELGVGVAEKQGVPEVSEASSPAVEESITYPVLEVAQTQGPITYPVVDTGVTVEPVEGEDLSTTKALLAKLEAMGFTDSKLNAELLEKNGFDLRKTLDDLCAAEEWDPILEELEEMGFYDTVMNRRLMFKNNGSVKRVVKELVQMYRDIQGKREKVE